MTEFNSWMAYHRFSREVHEKQRFFRTEAQESFLAALAASCAQRSETLDANTPFWRAQKGCEFQPYYQEEEHIDDLPAPYVLPRMKPHKNRAKEGRANPKGIPYLYGASHHDTAVAEVRPWIGSLISVGLFSIKRTLTIVNCTLDDDGRGYFYLEEPSPKEKEKAVWVDIDNAFAQPVEPNEDVAFYAPTQIVAELFRVKGYDGMAYRSKLGEGHNIVLFDPDVAELTHCQVVRVSSLKMEAKLESSPYAVWKAPSA
jgi:hypothetical protein